MTVPPLRESERPAARPAGAPGPLRSAAGTLRAVAWSFFGVRRSADHAHDLQRVHPAALVAAGLAAAALFVGLLVLLVRWVVASGVAA